MLFGNFIILYFKKNQQNETKSACGWQNFKPIRSPMSFLGGFEVRVLGVTHGQKRSSAISTCSVSVTRFRHMTVSTNTRRLLVIWERVAVTTYLGAQNLGVRIFGHLCLPPPTRSKLSFNPYVP